jgi:DNA polymerase-3 subunit alpha
MDGYNTPEELLQAVKDQGQTAMAITDHGTLSAHRETLIHAKELGIKPILGLEAYISPTDRFDKRSVKKRDDNTKLYHHIILLAKDQKGLDNLNKLSEIAWTEGYYMKPRIDREVLAEYKEGIIVLSGCMGGLIAKAIENGDMGEARILTRWFRDNFGDDFYMEVQAHNPKELNDALFALADEFGVKPIATADCHFAREEDRAVEEALLILSTNPKQDKEVTYELSKKISDPLERLDALYPDRPISFAKINLFISTREQLENEFRAAGVDRSDIFDNTVLLSESVGSFDIRADLDLLPKPKGGDQDSLLEKKARAGLAARGLADKPEYVARLDEELEVIKSKGFSSYFLIIGNMIAWAKSKDILVGPGRGSAAGSLVCYALGITEVDPIRWGLLFFRFINPDRNDYPDIDTDFEDARRGEVKDYLRRQYKHVGSIATFGRFQGKNSIRDAARVYCVPLGEVNKALKNLEGPPDKPEVFFDLFVRSDQGKEFMKKYPEVLPLARKLAGRIRSSGMHAAGLVLSKEPLNTIAPIQSAKDPQNPDGPRVAVVAYDMEAVADIGLQKLDALGLKTLTVVKETIETIKQRHGKDIVLTDIPLDDPAIYADFSNGFTKGIFQVEQPAYTSLLMRMKPENFDELAASNALVRPGAANTIGGEYLARKQGRAQVKYVHPVMESFTSETYGTIVYQEQVMLTMTELAGMKMTTADKVR